jgi:hypothetical protein
MVVLVGLHFACRDATLCSLISEAVLSFFDTTQAAAALSGGRGHHGGCGHPTGPADSACPCPAGTHAAQFYDHHHQLKINYSTCHTWVLLSRQHAYASVYAIHCLSDARVTFPCHVNAAGTWSARHCAKRLPLPDCSCCCSCLARCVGSCSRAHYRCFSTSLATQQWYLQMACRTLNLASHTTQMCYRRGQKRGVACSTLGMGLPRESITGLPWLSSSGSMSCKGIDGSIQS